MNKLTIISCVVLLGAFLANCGRRAPEPLSSDDVVEGWGEKFELVDTVATKEELVKEDPVEEKRVKKTRNPSKSSRNTEGYDNMRGFDPASEDDMDDNGMSRYMENDDDEGWD